MTTPIGLFSSKVGDIRPVLQCLSSGRAPSKSLVKTLVAGYDLTGVHPIQWGVQHEAIGVYEMSENVEVTPSGLWLSASGRLVGASPDGVIGSTKTGEVKCPYSARSAPLRQLPLGPKVSSWG